MNQNNLIKKCKTFIFSFFKWIKKNKVKSILIFLLLFIAFEYLTLPYFSIINLKKKNPKVTVLMEQRIKEGKSQGKNIRIDTKWIPLSRISKNLINAVLVAEDGTFFEHGGVDWYEVKEPIEKNIEEGGFKRGASTITQQLAKNLYLSTSKNPIRKLKELIITFRMERILSKDRILEIYLNVIEWGDGIFGVEKAAQQYFGKSSSMLDREESARLAAVIPSPRKHKPNSNSRYVQYRKNIILKRMEARGW